MTEWNAHDQVYWTPEQKAAASKKTLPVEKIRWFIDGKMVAEWDMKQLREDIAELDSFAQNSEVGDDSDWDSLNEAEKRLENKGLLPKKAHGGTNANP